MTNSPPLRLLAPRLAFAALMPLAASGCCTIAVWEYRSNPEAAEKAFPPRLGPEGQVLIDYAWIEYAGEWTGARYGLGRITIPASDFSGIRELARSLESSGSRGEVVLDERFVRPRMERLRARVDSEELERYSGANGRPMKGAAALTGPVGAEFLLADEGAEPLLVRVVIPDANPPSAGKTALRVLATLPAVAIDAATLPIQGILYLVVYLNFTREC